MGFIARLWKLFRSQTNLSNERIEGKMFACFGRNDVWGLHVRRFQGDVRERSNPFETSQDPSASIQYLPLSKNK